MGQGHPGLPPRAPFDPAVTSGAGLAARAALASAGASLDDVDACQIYDSFSYLTLLSLEGYGFCPPGEGGEFVAAGDLAPGGAMPTNTGGGHLSGFFMQGMTPLAEAVEQARGQAGDRQLE